MATYDAEVSAEFLNLKTLFVPVIIINIICLVFVAPGMMKFSQMVLGEEGTFYDLNERTQCISGDAGMDFAGNWFNWLKAALIITTLISLLNVVFVFAAGTKKPGENDSLFGKLSIFCNVFNLTILLLISFILFGFVDVSASVEVTSSETDVDLTEGYQMRDNGDYCFNKLMTNQKGMMKIFLVTWITLYGLGILFTLLAIRPLTGGEKGSIVKARKNLGLSKLIR